MDSPRNDLARIEQPEHLFVMPLNDAPHQSQYTLIISLYSRDLFERTKSVDAISGRVIVQDPILSHRYDAIELPERWFDPGSSKRIRPLDIQSSWHSPLQ